jgi:NAD(P)-dependent dehydrogenase (short-subunit alcohol dehydrogenase family)
MTGRALTNGRKPSVKSGVEETQMQIGKRLLDKVAIVTGGASGIGAGTARVFAAHGASVVICDLQDELGHTVAKEIADAGGRISLTLNKSPAIGAAGWRPNQFHPLADLFPMLAPDDLTSLA